MKIMKNKNSAEIGSIEVAELLDMSPDNVNYMARKGILPGYKDKKFWRRGMTREKIIQEIQQKTKMALIIIEIFLVVG